MPIILAILLSEVRSTGFKKVTQTISYLPHFPVMGCSGGYIYSPSVSIQRTYKSGFESVWIKAHLLYGETIIGFVQF